MYGNAFRVWSGWRESNPHCQLGKSSYPPVFPCPATILAASASLRWPLPAWTCGPCVARFSWFARWESRTGPKQPGRGSPRPNRVSHYRGCQTAPLSVWRPFPGDYRGGLAYVETCRPGFAEDGLPSGRTAGVPGPEHPAPWGAHSAHSGRPTSPTVTHIPPTLGAPLRPQWRTSVAVRGGTLQVQVGAGPTFMVSASVRRGGPSLPVGRGGGRVDCVSVPHAVRLYAGQVVAATDAVCLEHLDVEYAVKKTTMANKARLIRDTLRSWLPRRFHRRSCDASSRTSRPGYPEAPFLGPETGKVRCVCSGPGTSGSGVSGQDGWPDRPSAAAAGPGSSRGHTWVLGPGPPGG